MYISFVDNNKTTLYETENIAYGWCNLDEFIKRIRWLGDSDLLKEVLAHGIKRKNFFNVERIENYDFNFENLKENN